MKLLTLMAGAKVGGAELHFERFINRIRNENYDLQVAIRPIAERVKLLNDMGVSLSTAAFGGILDFSTRRKLSKIADEFKPDITMAWMNRASRYAPNHHGKLVGHMVGHRSLRDYGNCDSILLHTRAQEKHVLALGWNRNTYVIPNFVENEQATAESRANFDIPKDVPLVLCLGRLHRNKAFDTALKAIALLPDAWLVIAGSGPEEKALKTLCHDLGIEHRVRFIGWHSKPQALLKMSDVFLCSSRHEPFGLITLEALATKTPMVAASSEGPSQTLSHEESALLVEVDDHAAMAENVKRLLNEAPLQQKLSKQGFKLYQDKYSPLAVMPMYRTYFQSLLDNN